METYQGGYHHIECQGTEGALRECDIGDVTSDECSYVAVVSECSNCKKETCIYSSTITLAQYFRNKCFQLHDLVFVASSCLHTLLLLLCGMHYGTYIIGCLHS